MSERNRDQEINKLEHRGIDPVQFYAGKTRAQVDAAL